jgi:hypothetical protein
MHKGQGWHVGMKPHEGAALRGDHVGEAVPGRVACNPTWRPLSHEG